MIKKYILAFLAIFILVESRSINAYENIPPCFVDLETNFFTYNIVGQAFSMNRVSQSLVSTVLNDLNIRSQRVPALVRDQARTLNPNPLEYPFQVQAATALLKRTLYIVFRQAMIENNAYIGTNEVSIQSMFEYIWFNQSQRLVACLGQEAIVNQRVTE